MAVASQAPCLQQMAAAAAAHHAALVDSAAAAGLHPDVLLLQDPVQLQDPASMSMLVLGPMGHLWVAADAAWAGVPSDGVAMHQQPCMTWTYRECMQLFAYLHMETMYCRGVI